MRSLLPVARRAVWFASAILAALPCLLAFDFGGVLRWSHLAAAYSVVLAGVVLVAAFFPLVAEPGGRMARRNVVLLSVALLWAALIWFQSLRVSSGLSETLSPIAHAAFTDWLAPIGGVAKDSVPLSVRPHATSFWAAAVLPLILVFWCATSCFDVSKRGGFLLAALSIGVGLQAAYGFWGYFVPEHLNRPIQETSYGFGSFVNRNNAALFLNLGLAVSIGAIAWRLKQPKFSTHEEQWFEWDDFFDVLHDKWALLSSVAALFCLSALIVCGSGVGIIGLIFGALASVNWFRSRIATIAICLIFGVFLIGIAAIGLSDDMRRYAFSSLSLSVTQAEASGASDARYYHWQDAWTTAQEGLPLGAGFGGYADAYLPFQSQSPPAWFKHADNLWLELIVEQGLFGIALILMMFVILCRETSRLAASDDPVDIGLTWAMRFMIGAVLSTQFFDFGLLLPANCVLFVLVAGAVVGRSQVIAYLSQMNPTELPGPPTKASVMALAGCGILTLILSIASLPRLRDAAQEEWLVRTGVFTLATDGVEQESLRAHLSRLDEAIAHSPTPALYEQSAQFRHRLARLVDVESQQLETVDELIEAYRQTSHERKRVLGADSTSADAMELYAEAQDHAREALLDRPLEVQARTRLVYLDFIGDKSRMTEALINQLAILQGRDVKQLVKIGKLAEDSSHLELARDCYFSAAELVPAYAAQAVHFVERNPSYSLVSSVPKSPACIKRVAKYLMRLDEDESKLGVQTDVYLRFAIETLDCEAEPTRSEKAGCETLIADMCFFLEDWQAGLGYYRRASETMPADQLIRLTFAQRLFDVGEYDLALLEARKGRAQFPGSDRFQRLIDRMAFVRIDEATEDDETPENR